MSAADRDSDSTPDGQRWFTTTHWTVLLTAQQQDSPESAQALEQLCQTYWYPLYAFVRRKGYKVHEAEDLTQEFFARLLRRDFPAGIKPEGGKLRSYLLTALQHFMNNEWRRATAQKRGGGRPVFSLEGLGAEDRFQHEPADGTTPRALFDRRWASVLLEHVRRQLQEEYAAAGKSGIFARLEPCLTGAEPTLPYAELARQMDSSVGGIKMAVHRLRKRYGELLRQEISQTVAGPKDVEEEIRALLAAL